MGRMDVARQAPTRPASIEDLIVPVIPSMITSIVLDAVTDLSGPAKLLVASLLAVVLWWVLRGKRGATPARARTLVLKYWRWGLLVLGILAVLALTVTILLTGKPSWGNATLGLLIFAVPAVIAARGGRTSGAVAGAIAGGLFGICFAIVLGSAGFDAVQFGTGGY